MQGTSEIPEYSVGLDIILSMSITPGSRIGPYDVIAPLGEGGMGVVFRGRDSRLQRDVALKLLPDSLAGNPDRLSRFQREAQMLASLNHANIAQIYGLEQVNSSTCIVMELVEGETLADRLARGAPYRMTKHSTSVGSLPTHCRRPTNAVSFIGI